MKNKKLKKFLIPVFFGILIASSSILVAMAAIPSIVDVSTYSPSRLGIRIHQPGGNFHPGLPYASFNNFIDNENLAGTDAAACTGNYNPNCDERKFLIGKYCQDTDGNGFGSPMDEVTCQNELFYNSIPISENAKDGDIVRFEIYFHNNGADSYDEKTGSSGDATNVDIGIDLSSIQSSVTAGGTEFYAVKPEGFIYSPNNKYYTNPDIPSEQNLITIDGTPVRTATDDMQIIPNFDRLELEPIEDSIWLYITGITPGIHVTNSRQITLTSETGFEIPVTVTPHLEGNKLFLHFNRLPGCFRYSGFVYFDARIKIPAVCESIGAITAEPMPDYPAAQGQPAYRLTLDPNEINFSTGEIPENLEIVWTTTDPNGVFRAPHEAAGNSIQTEYNNTVYYVGGGTISAKAKAAEGIKIPEGACRATLSLAKTCEDLTIRSTDVIVKTRDSSGNLLDSPGHKLEVANLSILPEMPANVILHWSVPEGGGRLYMDPNVPDNAHAEVYISSRSPIYHVGRGPVNVEVSPAEGHNPGLTNLDQCTATIPFPFCEQITTISSEKIEGVSAEHILWVPAGAVDFYNNILPPSLKLIWTNYDPDGFFFYLDQGDDDPRETFTTGYVASTGSPRIGYKGYGPVIVTADVYEAQKAAACYKPISFSQTCEQLNVTAPQTIYVGDVAEISAAATNTDGDPFTNNGSITYSVVGPGDGLFFRIRPSGLGNSAMNLSTIAEQNTTEFNLNKTLLAAVSGPGDFGNVGPGNFDRIDPQNEAGPQAIEESAGAAEITTGSLQDFIEEFPVDNEALTGERTLTVPAGTEVYFYATRAGENSIKIDTNGTALEACTKYLDIVERIVPQKVCEQINITAPTQIPEQTLSTFRASSVDEDGNDFGEAITYLIDEGYGFIYTVKPEGKPENPYNPRSFAQNLMLDIFRPTINRIRLEGISRNAEAPRIPGALGGLGNIPENINPLALNPIGRSVVTVAPGTTVYIWAEKAGTNVIHVITEGTEEDDCKDDFSILPAPVVCATSTLEAYDYGDFMDQVASGVSPAVLKPVTCLERDGLYKLAARFYEDVEKTKLIPESEILTVLWTTTDENGFFYNQSESPLPADVPENSVITKDAVHYRGGGTVTAKLIKIGNTNVPANTPCVQSIGPCIEQLVCTNLDVKLFDITGNPVHIPEGTLFERQELNEISATASYDPALSEDAYSVYTSTQGFFVPFLEEEPLIKNTLVALLRALLPIITRANYQTIPGAVTSIEEKDGSGVFFITFPDATGEVLKVQAKDRAEIACTKTFQVRVETPCQSIVVHNSQEPDLFNPTQETLIWVGQESVLGDFNGTFRFEARNGASSAAGKFYLPAERNTSTALATNSRDFTVAQAQSGVYYIGGQTGDTISVVSTGNLASPACSATITSQVINCVDLVIREPNSPWEAEDVDNGEQDFEIDVTTNPAGNTNQFRYSWESTQDDTHWSGNSDPTDTTTTLRNTLFDINTEDNLRVTVEAIDSSGREVPACQDSISLEEEEEKNPTINKDVYDSDDEDWTTLINISGKEPRGERWIDEELDKFVTYKVEFETDGVGSVEIQDNGFEKGKIKSTNRSLDGTLTYKDMAIAVEKGSSEFLIYKSNGFTDRGGFDEEDTVITKIDGKNFSINDFTNSERNEDWFTDRYGCENQDEESSTNVCIEDIDDIEDLDGGFPDGESIRFKNTSQVDRIFILYQVQNDTEISEDTCKELRVDDGCGENFENEIEFTAYEDDDFEDEISIDEDDRTDSTTVIVLCPFILSRQSGDALFFSEIITGIDTEFCAPPNVIVIIRETPPIPREVFKSGTEEGVEEGDTNTFAAPSHDICKLSNHAEGDIPEEYQNKFEHFSSSICEMEAEVSEVWTESYINQAIEANIEKISRWSAFDSDTTINDDDISNLSQFDNFNSGVYVVEGGDMIIGENGAFEISGNVESAIPAAQTYIVKNGDIKIMNNIKYDDNNVDPTNPNSFPSAAFVALNGNILISNEVEEIDGILMAVNLDGVEGKGEIKSFQDTPTYTKRLTVSGSLIGNVLNIFTNRKAVGDPLADEGSITIRYDERILLNTPPGLSELVDITHLRVAN